MPRLFFIVWCLCSVPVAYLWSLQLGAAVAEYGLAAAIGFFALKLAGIAAGSWLVYDLFLKHRPKGGDKAPAANDNTKN